MLDANKKKIAIIGATSAIANACARLWAIEQANLFLVGRDEKKLEQTAEDLIVRGASFVQTYLLDVNEFANHSAMLNACFDKMERIDIVLIAHGTLPNQNTCEQNVDLALQEFSNNCLSTISLLTLLANRMEAQQSGTIAVISSVAGDRGRQSNYLYGTAKAAVTTFCEGLRARLFKKGVHVMTIKPGFVDTPMTRDLPLPKLLVVSAEKVAKAICNGIEKKTDTLYTPSYWWLIIFIIKLIPSQLFKRLKL